MSGTAVSTVGALLPRELLDRVANNDPKLPGLDATDFDLAPSERPRDAVTRSWNRLVSVWTAFRRAEETHANRRRQGHAPDSGALAATAA